MTTTTTTTEIKPTVQELLSSASINPQGVVAFLGGIYEHSTWVAEQFVATLKTDTHSSYESVSDLAAALKAIVNNASYDQKLKLLRVHPDLCEKVETLATLTQDSQQEQSNSGLQSLTTEEMTTFSSLNAQYLQKCNFPFILAVRNVTKYTVLAALSGRAGPNTTVEQEFVTALQQVHKIAWMRLLSKINTDNAKGFLTCHVLDTANGCPAQNMRIELHRLVPENNTATGLIKTRMLLGTFVTNDDGRLPGGKPALQGGKEFTPGVYEWTFYVGDYFASIGMTLTSGQPFLDVVPLRFGIDNPDDHYHVPLLVSPWSFSTYRGS